MLDYFFYEGEPKKIKSIQFSKKTYFTLGNHFWHFSTLPRKSCKASYSSSINQISTIQYFPMVVSIVEGKNISSSTRNNVSQYNFVIGWNFCFYHREIVSLTAKIPKQLPHVILSNTHERAANIIVSLKVFF